MHISEIITKICKLPIIINRNGTILYYNFSMYQYKAQILVMKVNCMGSRSLHQSSCLTFLICLAMTASPSSLIA